MWASSRSGRIVFGRGEALKRLPGAVKEFGVRRQHAFSSGNVSGAEIHAVCSLRITAGCFHKTMDCLDDALLRDTQGTKALIVTGSSTTRAQPFADALRAAGYEVAFFSIGERSLFPVPLDERFQRNLDVPEAAPVSNCPLYTRKAGTTHAFAGKPLMRSPRHCCARQGRESRPSPLPRRA